MISVTPLALVLSLVVTGPSAGLPAAPASPAVASPVPDADGASSGLPRPTGPYAVGRDVLHLVDESRPDPWVPEVDVRQLMVSMYYPAQHATGDSAPYMTAEEARLLLQSKVPGSTVPVETISGLRTFSYTGARPVPGRYPLVVLSPGLSLPRATLSSLAEDLASHGYVVALVDHTYESTGTTFPDGQTLACVICDQPPTDGPGVIPLSRAQDISFVLDQLTGLRATWRYAELIDPDRIGMAGHSIGGASAATAMAADTRIRAGVNLDGTFRAPVPESGLGGRPFLLLGTRSDHAPGLDDTWDRDWTNLDGWKRWLTVAGTEHDSFNDAPVLEALLGLADPAVLSPQRSVEITRDYVGAFFDLHLKGKREPLLDGPSASNPEVAFEQPALSNP